MNFSDQVDEHLIDASFASSRSFLSHNCRHSIFPNLQSDRIEESFMDMSSRILHDIVHVEKDAGV